MLELLNPMVSYPFTYGRLSWSGDCPAAAGEARFREGEPQGEPARASPGLLIPALLRPDVRWDRRAVQREKVGFITPFAPYTLPAMCVSVALV